MKNEGMIAIIPARGGSTRIPRKNIIDFMGKPLIAWTIEAAIKTGLFDKIIISTEDPEIAEISKEWGAEVPFLRQTAYDNHSHVAEATLVTLLQIEENLNTTYKTVVQLFAVCPLRDEKHIVDAVRYYQENNIDFLLSSYEFNWMNPWWACKLNEKNIPERLFPDAWPEARVRSQDLPKLFAPTGAIWIADACAFKKCKTFYGPEHVFWPMDWKCAVDIDNYEDLEVAKVLYSLKNSLDQSPVSG